MPNPVTPHGSDRAKLTPLDAAEIEAAEGRIEKARKGPWMQGPHYRSDVESPDGRVAECGTVRGEQAIWDAAFIANSRTDLPRALEGNRRWLEAQKLLAAFVAGFDSDDWFAVLELEAARGIEHDMLAPRESFVALARALLAEPSPPSVADDTTEVHHG